MLLPFWICEFFQANLVITVVCAGAVACFVAVLHKCQQCITIFLLRNDHVWFIPVGTWSSPYVTGLHTFLCCSHLYVMVQKNKVNGFFLSCLGLPLWVLLLLCLVWQIVALAKVIHFVPWAMLVALMTWYSLLNNCSCERSMLIMMSCPGVLVLLEHPVTGECLCWTIFQQLFPLHYCTCYNFCVGVDYWVASVPLSVLQNYHS